jgi:transglutaminase-like putative cysteine protease
MKYSKEGTGWGRGDSVWACDSRYGNCTDFHSLFMSLARAKEIPARFEIGFMLPNDKPEGAVTGYHCWAYFFANERWVPVDISEADKNPSLREYYFGNLTANRVTFSTGRDIVLTPPQTGDPINFFVYPYVEVHGKPLPPEGLKVRFSYNDLQ